MLHSEELTFAYPSGPTFSFPNIHCEKGKSVLILGESGKGKTTLLHLLAGLLRPTRGNIHIGDTDITQLDIQRLDRFRGRHIGLIFQVSHFVAALTVEENLRLAQYLADVPQSDQTVRSFLDRLGLGDKGSQRPYRLSQGQQQRVAIARALLNRPQVILADEPTSSLDDRHCFEVLDLLEEQAQAAEAALVIVTHDQRLKDRIPHHIPLAT